MIGYNYKQKRQEVLDTVLSSMEASYDDVEAMTSDFEDAMKAQATVLDEVAYEYVAAANGLREEVPGSVWLGDLAGSSLERDLYRCVEHHYDFDEPRYLAPAW